MHMAFSAFQEQSPCRLNLDLQDVNDALHSFGLRKDRDVDSTSVFSDSSSDSYYSALSSINSLEEDVEDKFKNQIWFDEDQERLIKSRNIADDHERLFWAYIHFKAFDHYTLDALEGNSGLRGSLKSSPSTSNVVDFLYANIHPRYSSKGLYRYDNDKFREFMNCSGNKSDAKNDDLLMTSWCEMGICENIQEEEDHHKHKERVFWDYTYLLVRACEDDSLVREVLLERELFIDVAFCKQGASSIIKLIKKLKIEESCPAFAVTRILSTRFLDIMTHPTARIVIQQCLLLFGPQPNKILYEKAMYHFKVLAIDEEGCKALNDCINTISGDQRERLLNQIANVSDYLSNHPFGNYVVQNVLALKDKRVSTKILKCLQGQFIHLAQTKGGSHVVEKCMESCKLGIICVVKEILDDPRAPFLLAKHQFGNYVIQNALNKTMKPAFSRIYFALVRSLEPYCEQLDRTKGGKNVIRLLEKAYSM